MTIQINRNIYWSQLFAEQLSNIGVKDVCISPGSRNTPLTYAFATNQNFEKYISVDERSSAYFALGLAKKSQNPVVVVTTSGTAVAELYPAIIEAYNQRVPLIICTADRPAYLRNTGANQTINQDNIYSNHIRFFYDTGLPDISDKNILRFLSKTVEGFNIAARIDVGPVHFNFPFEKPFEPDFLTDEISAKHQISDNNCAPQVKSPIEPEILNVLKFAEKIIAFVGPNNFNSATLHKIDQVLKEKNIPILADSASNLRYLKNCNSIVNHTAFIRFEDVISLRQNDVILLFGEAPVSNSNLAFIEKTNCKKYSINQFGDLKDPSRTVDKIIQSDEISFLEQLLKYMSPVKPEFLREIKSIDGLCEEIKSNELRNADISVESKIAKTIIESIPDSSNLFIGNSTVIRDFDLFTSSSKKNIQVHTNRGTSGIEGNIATALGIAKKSDNPTFLVLGDLSFYYDSNSLLLAKQNSIPLTIFLVNNNGGGIFSMLPISNQKDIFDRYFNTPLDIDFKHFAELYDGNFYQSETSSEFYDLVKKINTSELNIIEIKTDSKKSADFRKLYIQSIREKITTNVYKL